MDAQERHNRQVMLQRVKLFWLKGVLEESLHGAELIDLNLSYRHGAVNNGHQPDWQGEAFDQPLPLGTPIVDVFDAAQGALLIMGEPGAGKTTLLLQLVTGLLQRAEQDLTQPIPVVFSLASWLGHQAMSEWLVEELSQNYEVPRKLGRTWLHQERLLPLLDGLDEVDKERRDACARAINQFRREHPGVYLSVTSRSNDYTSLPTNLDMTTAVVLQPLSLEQIDLYLAGVGQRLAGLRAALQADGTLRELAQTPLMLSIMTLAYYRMPANIAISVAGNREIGRKLLFDVYVERMSRYREGEKAYDPADTVRWLAWLARMMARHNQTLFFLEAIQPNWLPRERQRRFADRFKLWVGALIAACWLLAGTGAFVLGAGWPALLAGGVTGTLLGSWPALSGRFLWRNRADWYRIDTTEKVDWSWPWALVSLGVGGLSGLFLGWLGTWLAGLQGAEVTIPWMLLLPLFVGLSLVLELALLKGDVKLRTTPGQGILQSRRIGRLVGFVAVSATLALALLMLVVGRGLGLSYAWGRTLALIIGASLYLGLLGGMIYGGLASWQHRRLLALLESEGMVSPDYDSFLDYAAERNLLRKVGGGYMFAHALLLAYFKDLEE